MGTSTRCLTECHDAGRRMSTPNAAPSLRITRDNDCWIIWPAKGQSIAHVHDEAHVYEFAAAPEMRRALTFVRDAIDQVLHRSAGVSLPDDAVIRVDLTAADVRDVLAALAKAEGR